MILRVIVLILVAQANFVAAQTLYTVNDAVTRMQDQIRYYLLPEVSPEIWLSLTVIGAVAEKGDQPAINELANFCPQPSPTISAFGGIRPLDQVYEKAILDMVGPKSADSAAVTAANEVLNDQVKYSKYNEYLATSVEILKNITNEKDQSALPSLYRDYRNLEKDWRARGFKDEIDGAFFTLDANDGLFGTRYNTRRLNVLTAYKDNGLRKQWAVGSFNSPLSEVSPPVNDWDSQNGWVGITLDSSTSSNQSSTSSNSSSGGGFLRIGGLIGGLSSGGGNSSSSSSSDVKHYTYSLEVKRVRIIRDWLDYRVFSTVGGWAWKKAGDMSEYPLISGGVSAENTPIVPTFVIYKSSVVECPMIPTEMIIAKNVSITLTTSKAFFEQVNTAGSSGGGGMFGGIIGGSTKSSWATSNVSTSGDDVTFTVKAPGIAVIGLISQLVGRIPAPDPAYEWPEEAWLERDQ